jgi:uncharacterized small protein (DUF1192 family)
VSEPGVEPTAAEIRAEVLGLLLETVRSGGKKRHVRFVCEHHPRHDPKKSPPGVIPQGLNANGNVYHEIDVFVADTAVINAAKELLDRTEGKPGTQKPKERPRIDATALEDLSDDDLAARIAVLREEVEGGEATSGNEERAA